MPVFFRRICARTTAETMVVERKHQKALALLYLASGPLPNVANSSDVPTEFAAENNKYEVLEKKFRNGLFAVHQKDNPFIDIRFINFSSIKLQYSRTIDSKLSKTFTKTRRHMNSALAHIDIVQVKARSRVIGFLEF